TLQLRHAELSVGERLRLEAAIGLLDFEGVGHARVEAEAVAAQDGGAGVVDRAAQVAERELGTPVEGRRELLLHAQDVLVLEVRFHVLRGHRAWVRRLAALVVAGYGTVRAGADVAQAGVDRN